MSVATETPPTIPAEIIERFRAIDLACIGDALGGLHLNCVEYRLKPLDPDCTMCGPAVTMRLIPLQDRNLWYETERHPRELVHLANPGDVLVIDIGGDLKHGIWGGNVSNEDGVPAGLGGVVIDGVCRDQHDVIRSGIPTFVRGTSPLHGHGVYGTTCFNTEPVRIGDISVNPGDLMIGDADGIAVIPAARAEEIVALAEERHILDTTPKLGTPEDSKARSRQRNRLYDLPVPPEDR
jgi:4-hydroxy-4-methyl-2-oxoglutarate aldolase